MLNAWISRFYGNLIHEIKFLTDEHRHVTTVATIAVLRHYWDCTPFHSNRVSQARRARRSSPGCP